eukprot:1097861-Rhodomonas_salina.1
MVERDASLAQIESWRDAEHFTSLERLASALFQACEQDSEPALSGVVGTRVCLTEAFHQRLEKVE